jgi:hypothetical protein
MQWNAKAEVVAATLKSTLWRADRKACFDKDINGAGVTTVVHNNLRMCVRGEGGKEEERERKTTVIVPQTAFVCLDCQTATQHV